MLGQMQDWPLTLDKVLDHARVNSGDRAVVTRVAEGPLARSTYAGVHHRARLLASALRRQFSLRLGERVAVMGWSTLRHYETCWAVAGVGAVFHPLNPQLTHAQLAAILAQSKPAILMVGLSFVPLVERIREALEGVRAVMILADEEHMPDTVLAEALSYETVLEQGDSRIVWGGFDENTAAALIHTAGVAGAPRGVLHSHRAIVLNAMAAVSPNALNLSADDTLMAMAPLFHALGWGAPAMAPLAGAKLVLPGARLDGESVCTLMEGEGVTIAVGTPGQWRAVIAQMDRAGRVFGPLKRAVSVGAPLSDVLVRALEDTYKIQVINAFGAADFGPIAAVSRPDEEARALPRHEQIARRVEPGRALFTAEFAVVDAGGEPARRDGATVGDLKVRGASAARAYYGDELGAGAVDEAGWLNTGDVAAMDSEGVVTLVDRAKDLIGPPRSAVSSIALENAAEAHPRVSEAAAIGAPDAQGRVRPVVFVTLVSAEGSDPAEIRDFIAARVRGDHAPADVVFVDKLPRTATGSVDKAALREGWRAARSVPAKPSA